MHCVCAGGCSITSTTIYTQRKKSVKISPQPTQVTNIQARQRPAGRVSPCLPFYGEPTWRNSIAPLDELVSTILSQNTMTATRPGIQQNSKRILPPGKKSEMPRLKQ
jgi:hypothetical protein